MQKYFKSLKLPIKYNNTGLDTSEKDLIENRINRKLDDSCSTCTYHRYSLGIYYRPSTKCIYPDHDSAKIVNKPTSSKRAATYSQLSYLVRRFPEGQFITGGQLCMKHIKLINNGIQDEKENANLNDSLALSMRYKPMKLFLLRKWNSLKKLLMLYQKS